MKAILLAGGVRAGQELPGASIPRSLWPLPHEPVIAGVIRFVRQFGIDKVAISANGKTRMIREDLLSRAISAEDVEFSEDAIPRGPAGCLKDLESWLAGDTACVLQGAAWYDFDLERMAKEHRESGAVITVAAVARHGVVEPAGVFMIEPAALAYIQTVGYQDIKEQLLPRVIQAGLRVQCHVVSGKVQLIHGTENYLQALNMALSALRPEVTKDYIQIKPGIWQHATAKVHPTARLIGSVWIDAEAQIGAGSLVMGPTLIGPKAVVNDGCVVRASVVMHNAQLSSTTELIQAVIAPGQATDVRKHDINPIDIAPWRRAISYFSRPETARPVRRAQESAKIPA